ncbi:hypothetical protein E2C01_033933 [Portunus trituberculatus]|uniref:Uncharacterized protein n=1 Tax=Portunus trituberculatus TaxID=210409 RepID=A0A5B7F499_PORTR|nr:hypothetical protein [Portunus trituberculatus]
MHASFLDSSRRRQAVLGVLAGAAMFLWLCEDRGGLPVISVCPPGPRRREGGKASLRRDPWCSGYIRDDRMQEPRGRRGVIFLKAAPQEMQF